MRKAVIFILFLMSFSSLAQQDIWMGSRMDGFKLLDDGNTVDTWGYGIYTPGLWFITVPGPVLEFTQGDSVNLHFVNVSPEDHTIHLHGMDVSTEEDGVPATSFAVHSNDTAEYNFKAANSGTFIYHCHVLTTLHLTMGMYGMIVVNASEPNKVFNGGPSYSSSYNFLSSDMDESVNSNPLSPGLFNELTTDYFMVNGLAGNQLYNSVPNQVSAYVGDSVLLRIGNIAYSKVKYIFPGALNAKAYMSDGRVLPASFDCDTLEIYPGERYSVLLVPTSNVDTDIMVNSYEMRNDQLQNTNLIKLNGDLGYGYEEDHEVNVYPNPTNGVLYFLSDKSNGNLAIYDLNGSVVYSETLLGNSAKLDLRHLQGGTYILRYMDESYKIMLQ